VSLCAVVAGVGLAVAGEDPRPIEKARPGQWVIHGETPLNAFGETLYSYQWVEKVDGRKVHLKTQAIRADRKTGIDEPVAGVVDLDKKPPDNDGPKATSTTLEEITVNGKKLSCRKVETITIDPVLGKLTTTVWTSSSVPIFGMVRTVKVDKDGRETSRVELLDWGETGGKEKPLDPAPAAPREK
jgi:hypothetical protein